MNRNVNELTAKARRHQAYADETGTNFVVESGTSGNLYRVHQHANGMNYYCGCVWQNHNEASECSHVLAVRMLLRRIARRDPIVEVRADGAVIIRS